MRRFSSEGSLLDLDFLPWKRVALKDPDNGKNRESGTYTPHMKEDELGGGSGFQTPTILEPRASPPEARKKGMNKEHSVSVETLSELGKQDKSHLGVCVISGGCRAYSDGQLAPANKGSTESMEGDNLTPPSPSSSANPFPLKPQHRHQHKAKLAAAKLHLKSLFGQSPTSSNSNLSNADPKDSATERRSRLVFMRQWSQVGHGKKRKISQEELEKWAESLNALLASHNERTCCVHRQRQTLWCQMTWSATRNAAGAGRECPHWSTEDLADGGPDIQSGRQLSGAGWSR
ncbi:uncharacterized protein si:ch211-152p11.4 isoform X3 [Sander lucioperca]|uniref:uncharacterized protein si:ch211-152p11.4 isoform X3 n=1 Tax=Sander lucioperca TaxID=283035 RepID=UPI00125E5810|nr:uncharacterized protein si:ch211-152p11.4 isoform X3 [Sander lucioperca]